MIVFKIDVDGVLRDIITVMCDIYNKEYNENITPDDVFDYQVNKVFTKCDNAEKFFFIDHAKEVFLYAPAIEYTREALKIIHDKGHKIIICTWQLTNENKKYTLDFLVMNDLYYDDICFTKDKHFVKADVIVDDNPEFINGETDENIIKVLINTTYNKDVAVPYALRFDSLYDFVTTINRD